MASSQDGNIGIWSGYTDGDNGWTAQHNLNWDAADALVMCAVINATTTTPPGSPAAGDSYIVAPSATGAWSGKDGKIAVWQARAAVAAWQFYTPKAGWVVANKGDGNDYKYSGSAWAIANGAETTTTAGALIYSATTKTTPADADELGLMDSAAGNVLKSLMWVNLKNAVWSAWGALIAAGTQKSTPVDADKVALSDSAASNATKYSTWANIKAVLKTYFDTLYAPKAPNIVTITYASTISVDFTSQPNNTIFRCALTGNVTVNITGASDGQKGQIELAQDATGSRIVTLGTGFAFGTDITAFTATTTASKTDYLGVVYDNASTKYRILAISKGY